MPVILPLKNLVNSSEEIDRVIMIFEIMKVLIIILQGDSGGPLVYKQNTIIGVVSGISIGCNENNEPGIYCRVSSYIGFIKNALNDVTDKMRIMTF